VLALATDRQTNKLKAEKNAGTRRPPQARARPAPALPPAQSEISPPGPPSPLSLSFSTAWATATNPVAAPSTLQPGPEGIRDCPTALLSQRGLVEVVCYPTRTRRTFIDRYRDAPLNTLVNEAARSETLRVVEALCVVEAARVLEAACVEEPLARAPARRIRAHSRSRASSQTNGARLGAARKVGQRPRAVARRALVTSRTYGCGGHLTRGPTLETLRTSRSACIKARSSRASATGMRTRISPAANIRFR
jgi:hypothetical protein